jgi:hypothetical protein
VTGKEGAAWSEWVTERQQDMWQAQRHTRTVWFPNFFLGAFCHWGKFIFLNLRKILRLLIPMKSILWIRIFWALIFFCNFQYFWKVCHKSQGYFCWKKVQNQPTLMSNDLPVFVIRKCHTSMQGWGSGLIQSGSGSEYSILAQSGSRYGSRSKLKQNFRRFFRKSKLKVKDTIY